MDWESILKIAKFLLGLGGTAKLVYEVVVHKRTVMRKDYEFSRDFLAEVASGPHMHPFLKEAGYQALAGSNEVGAVEIEYLLSLERPDRALRDYMLGRDYLEYRPCSNQPRIFYKQKYQSEWSRAWRSYGSFLLYGLFVLLALLPLLISPLFKDQKVMWPTFFVSFFLFGAYAAYFLLIGIRIRRGEQLVRNQKRREQ